jgi:hypothetical protein
MFLKLAVDYTIRMATSLFDKRNKVRFISCRLDWELVLCNALIVEIGLTKTSASRLVLSWYVELNSIKWINLLHIIKNSFLQNELAMESYVFNRIYLLVNSMEVTVQKPQSINSVKTDVPQFWNQLKCCREWRVGEVIWIEPYTNTCMCVSSTVSQKGLAASKRKKPAVGDCSWRQSVITADRVDTAVVVNV